MSSRVSGVGPVPPVPLDAPVVVPAPLDELPVLPVEEAVVPLPVPVVDPVVPPWPPPVVVPFPLHAASAIDPRKQKGRREARMPTSFLPSTVGCHPPTAHLRQDFDASDLQPVRRRGLRTHRISNRAQVGVMERTEFRTVRRSGSWSAPNLERCAGSGSWSAPNFERCAGRESWSAPNFERCAGRGAWSAPNFEPRAGRGHADAPEFSSGAQVVAMERNRISNGAQVEIAERTQFRTVRRSGSWSAPNFERCAGRGHGAHRISTGA